MARRIHSLVGSVGLLCVLGAVANAGMEAPTQVTAAADGHFHYSWTYTAETTLIVAGYNWYGVNNVTGGMIADCFCDPVYCVMLPGDELTMTVDDDLDNVSADGLVRNTFSSCSISGSSVDTRIVSPTTHVGDPIAASLALAVSPNPCRAGGTEISYSLPKEGPASITIHDVSGRRLATLVDGTMPSGARTVRWDANSAGRHVTPGVYFARLDFMGQTRMQRILVLN